MKIALFSGAGAVRCAASTYASVLKSGLEQAGHRVLLVLADPEVDDCYQQAGTLYCPARPAPGLYGMAVRSAELDAASAVLDAFRPELLHVVTLDEMGLWATRYARQAKVPLVATVLDLHDLMATCSVNKMYSNLARRKARSSARKILAACQAACAPSSQTGPLLESLDIPCKLRGCPFCVDVHRFQPAQASQAMRAQLKIPQDAAAFVFAGRLIAGCGLGELLESWAEAIGPEEPLHLVVAGSGPDAVYFAEKARTLSLTKQVSFVGELKQEALNACFACCRAYVAGGASPAIQASPLEAMAAGLPNVLDAGSANAALLKDGVNGFAYTSPQEMAQRLRQFAALDAAGTLLVQKLVRKCARGLSPQALAAAMQHVYADACAALPYTAST